MPPKCCLRSTVNTEKNPLMKINDTVSGREGERERRRCLLTEEEEKAPGPLVLAARFCRQSHKQSGSTGVCPGLWTYFTPGIRSGHQRTIPGGQFTASRRWCEFEKKSKFEVILRESSWKPRQRSVRAAIVLTPIIAFFFSFSVF